MSSKFTRSEEPSLSFSRNDFAKALEQHDYQFEQGQVVRGKVFEYASEGAYIDIGGKSPAFVPLKEASLKRVTAISEVLPLNEEMEFLIISGQDAEGQITLSRRQLEVNNAWDRITELSQSSALVQMLVTGTNKGGVTGEVEGLRSFIPRSHLIEKNDLESLVGQLLSANFLEVDRENNKLILSQRQAARAAAIVKLQKGLLVSGKVIGIKPYGVFVSFEDGITGLLHIKQISESHIDSLTTLFKIGQQIKTMVVEIDEFKNRISLSTKILENYPGELLEKMDEVMATAEERVEKALEKLAT